MSSNLLSRFSRRLSTKLISSCGLVMSDVSRTAPLANDGSMPFCNAFAPPSAATGLRPELCEEEEVVKPEFVEVEFEIFRGFAEEVMVKG